MKRRRSLYLLIIMLMGGAVTEAMAQQQKVGYVDTDYILSNLAEYQGVQQQLSSQSAEWNKQLEELKQEVEQLKEDFEAKEILYTDELREQKQQEINEMMEQQQQFLEQKFGSDGEYFQLQKQLLEPIQRKVMDAVVTVAGQQNFDFVFDRAQDTNMLFGHQDWNLTNDVLQELGVTLNNPSN